jgi:N-acyl-D-aspartate/D-glutamate deacylase
MKLFTLTLAFLAALSSFGQSVKFDLVIKNAKIFDSRTGALSENKTILIKDGIIAKVTGKQKNYSATKTIDAG